MSEPPVRSGVTLIRVGNRSTRGSSKVVVEAEGPVKVTAAVTKDPSPRTSLSSSSSSSSLRETAASQQPEASSQNQLLKDIGAAAQSEIGASAPVGEGGTTASQSFIQPDIEADTSRDCGDTGLDIVVEQFQKMAGIGDLAITKPAPNFECNSVVDGQFKTVKLSDYKGKYLVIFFYPLDFTFVCPTEIIAFSDRVEEFRSIGCEVVACSTDSVFSHLAWVNTPRKQGGLGPMKIPLIADKTMEISKKYGCLKEDEGVAFRGLYIIDDKGILRQITINDLPVGRSVDETLRLVQAFQFTDKHGEVCPAGWRPGKETMKPDPKGSKDYFSKVN